MIDVLATGNLVWEVSAQVAAVPPDLPTDPSAAFGAVLRNLVSLREDGGGSAANTCVHLAQAGLRVVFVGRAGTDGAGRNARRSLTRHGIDARIELMPGRRTKHNLFLVPTDGSEPVLRVGVPEQVVPPLPIAGVDPDLLATARILHLDRASATELALAQARGGAPVTLDLHTDPGRPVARTRLEALLPLLDVLMVSHDAAAARARRLGIDPDPAACARSLAALGIPWVVVTRGALGAVACERDHPAFPVPPVPVARTIDPTGAGDAFMAALIAGRLNGAPFAEACARAAQAGARACGRLGARP